MTHRWWNKWMSSQIGVWVVNKSISAQKWHMRSGQVNESTQKWHIGVELEGDCSEMVNGQ